MARTLRRDSDRDVFQAIKLSQDLQSQLQEANSKLQTVWGALSHILSFIGQPGDEARDWSSFAPLIPSRFSNFLRGILRRSISNILGHVRAISPGANLNIIVDPAVSPDYLMMVSAHEADLAPLVDEIVSRIDVGDDAAGPTP